MEQYCYHICGLKIAVRMPEPMEIQDKLDVFRIEQAPDPDAIYQMVWRSGASILSGTTIHREYGYFVERTGDGFDFHYNVGYDRNDHCIDLHMDPEQINYTLMLPEFHRELLKKEKLDLAPLLAPELLFIRNHRLMIHASFIRHQGKGILFTGPSGMGKSTQSGLWEQYVGAEILNGDRTVLHIDEDEVSAWGSPYAGTSGIYRNESAPAAAIISLRQGPENTIRRLRGREALAELMPRIATAHWADQWHLKAMDLAIELVEQVPVYLLSCRPDREAVELVKHEIFGEDSL